MIRGHEGMNGGKGVLHTNHGRPVRDSLLKKMGRTVLRSAITIQEDDLTVREGGAQSCENRLDERLDRTRVVIGGNRDEKVGLPNLAELDAYRLGEEFVVHRSEAGNRRGARGERFLEAMISARRGGSRSPSLLIPHSAFSIRIRSFFRLPLATRRLPKALLCCQTFQKREVIA